MLFKKTSEVIGYADLHSETNFAAYSKHIRNVEVWHVVPVIGRELYDSLNNAYALITDENLLSPANKLLLDQCRRVIGPYLCYYYAPKSDVKLGDGGMQRQETANSKSAFQEQRTDFREANLMEAQTNIEFLLEFLELNQSSYPEWVDSSAFANYKKLFIKSGREFNEYFSSQSPFRNFWAMRPKMVDVEDNIREVIGDALFTFLKTKNLEGTAFSAKENDLLFKLKKAIAYLTVAFSVPYLNVRIDGNGLSIMDSQRAARDADAKRTNADAEAKNNLIKSATTNGQDWMGKSMKFINDNASDFPSWLAPVAAEAESINNEVGGLFAFG